MKALSILSTAASALLLGSCAYSWGFNRPQGAETVAIQIFENDTFYRGVEVNLADKISREIVERSGMRLRSVADADAVIKGRILTVTNQLLLESPNRDTRFAAVYVEAEVELVNRSTGKAIQKIRVRDKGNYLSDNGQDRESATDTALGRLAEKIVLALCAPKPEMPENP